jgi:hypothetical protein
MHYNFVRIHQSLRVTPAMAAGVTSKLWSITDMVRVIEDREDVRSGARLHWIINFSNHRSPFRYCLASDRNLSASDLR